MARVFVIGDIHGRVTALHHVLTRAKFDFENDVLINLGDVVDGGFYTKQCIDLLLNVKNHILIVGNHDQWALHWFLTGTELPVWYHQGGMFTIRSYNFDYKSAPQTHIDLLKSARSYYIDDKRRIFVHGGFDAFKPIEEQQEYDIMWDRSLIGVARGIESSDPKQRIPGIEIPGYNMVFVGHTSTPTYGSLLPLRFNNLMMLDTGAGWSGKLTLMNVDTHQFYQSKIMEPSNVEKYDKKIAEKDWSIV